MKKIACLAALIGAGWVTYALFRPVIEYNFGWKELPDEVFYQRFNGVENKDYSEIIDVAKNIVDSIQQTHQLPSISIATMIEGRMIWSYAVGYQDIEGRIPADTSTQYRVGSVSKALTSLGLGKLIERKLIDLDSSVQYYTHHFIDKPRITIRQLASHQSGIRNYGACLCFPIWEYYRNNTFRNVEESLGEFESDELLFSPGEAFSYSSYNFTALSFAMEKAANKEFLQLMDQEVFQPLGMRQTQGDSDTLETKAVPYQTEHTYYKIAPEVNLSNKWAGGGFVSTPSDLVRAGNALLTNRLLTSESVQQLITPQRLNNDSINHQKYALGWRHSSSGRYFEGQEEVEVIHHGGMAVGGQALLVVYPEYKMVMALTINKSGMEGSFELFDYLTLLANEFLKTRSVENERYKM